MMELRTTISDFRRFMRKEEDDWPPKLRLAAGIAELTLKGMTRAAFKQSAALQKLAARNLIDFIDQYERVKRRRQTPHQRWILSHERHQVDAGT